MGIMTIAFSGVLIYNIVGGLGGAYISGARKGTLLSICNGMRNL
jgi:hypothetical protein